MNRVYLEASLVTAQRQKALGEMALSQLDGAEFQVRVAPGVNTVAQIVAHLAGNLRSRWTSFLTTDGEKPDRDRDGEFAGASSKSRTELMDAWREGWARLIGTLVTLTDEDYDDTVTIRGEAHTVALAIQRALDHNAYHIGQIVTTAKIIKGDAWRTILVVDGRGGENA